MKIKLSKHGVHIHSALSFLPHPTKSNLHHTSWEAYNIFKRCTRHCHFIHFVIISLACSFWNQTPFFNSNIRVDRWCYVWLTVKNCMAWLCTIKYVWWCDASSVFQQKPYRVSFKIHDHCSLRWTKIPIYHKLYQSLISIRLSPVKLHTWAHGMYINCIYTKHGTYPLQMQKFSPPFIQAFIKVDLVPKMWNALYHPNIVPI